MCRPQVRLRNRRGASRTRRSGAAALAVLTALLAAAPGPPAPGTADIQLRTRLQWQGVRPPLPPPSVSPPLIRLGQSLFFDKILSGNRDTACATCHHPTLMTGDDRCLSVGTVGVGLGPDRAPAPGRPQTPRNATELFDRGDPAWRTMFWDGRIEQVGPGLLRTPAGDRLPPGLSGVLAAQALFPLGGRDEMRGQPGDPGNELALLADDDWPGIWAAVMARLRAIPGYQARFAAAYPGVAPQGWGIAHAANAIAAFEATAFTRADSPFDRYLAGNDNALDPEAKRGAWLFFGRARCAVCHTGPLLTDQQYHNLAVPQLGPGKAPDIPLDLGRGRVDGLPADQFAFRTPPLRNVAATGPWMHNGAYTTLAGAVRHHQHPTWALLHYDATQLPPLLRSTVIRAPAVLRRQLQTLDSRLRAPIRLSNAEVAQLVAFLESLTSPTLEALPEVIPAAVPSGLPVDRLAD